MRTILILFTGLFTFSAGLAQLTSGSQLNGASNSFYHSVGTAFSGDLSVENVPLILRQEPNFSRRASQFSADLATHFSLSDGDAGSSNSESGITATLSYLYGVAPQLKVGGGFGVMTIKSGSKERVFPLFARAEYQFLPRFSATANAGYGLIPTTNFIVEAKNGLHGSATVAFDLVSPESAYTSRIGIGIVTQRLNIGRNEIIRENTNSGPVEFTQFVERSGWLRRFQINFTHAWRLPTPSSGKRAK
jgi:hypothetical protein